MSMVTLPAVGRIQGLVSDGAAKTPPADRVVELQYTAHTPQETWHRLQIPLLDALYLLNLLQDLSTHEGLDHLRQPPR